MKEENHPKEETPPREFVRTKIDRIINENGFQIKTEVFTSTIKKSANTSLIDRSIDNINESSPNNKKTTNDVTYDKPTNTINYSDIYNSQKYYETVLVLY